MRNHLHMIVAMVHSDSFYGDAGEDLIGELYEKLLDGLVVADEKNDGYESGWAGEFLYGHKKEVEIAVESILEERCYSNSQ